MSSTPVLEEDIVVWLFYGSKQLQKYILDATVRAVNLAVLFQAIGNDFNASAFQALAGQAILKIERDLYKTSAVLWWISFTPTLTVSVLRLVKT